MNTQEEQISLMNKEGFSKLEKILILLSYVILPIFATIYIILTKIDFINLSIYSLALSYTVIFSTVFSYLGTRTDKTAAIFFAQIFYSAIIFVYPITYFISNPLLSSIMSFIPLMIGIIYLIVKMPKYTQIVGFEDEIEEAMREDENKKTK